MMRRIKTRQQSKQGRLPATSGGGELHKAGAAHHGGSGPGPRATRRTAAGAGRRSAGARLRSGVQGEGWGWPRRFSRQTRFPPGAFPTHLRCGEGRGPAGGGDTAQGGRPERMRRAREGGAAAGAASCGGGVRGVSAAPPAAVTERRCAPASRALGFAAPSTRACDVTETQQFSFSPQSPGTRRKRSGCV